MLAPSASHGCRWLGPVGLGRAKFLSLPSLPRAAGLWYRGGACTAAGSSLAANEGGPLPGAAAWPFLPPADVGAGSRVCVTALYSAGMMRRGTTNTGREPSSRIREKDHLPPVPGLALVSAHDCLTRMFVYT